MNETCGRGSLGNVMGSKGGGVIMRKERRAGIKKERRKEVIMATES